MIGWKIFKHAVLMVVRNFASVLRIALLPIIFASVVLGFSLTASGSGLGLLIARGNIWALAPLMLIGLFCTFWVLVAWHRFVLLEEMPNGWLTLPSGQIISYFWKVLQIVLLGLVAVIPAAILAFMFRSIPVLMFSVLGIYLICIGFLFLRLSIVLPAAAIGKPLTFSEALGETEGQFGVFFLLIISFFGFQLLLQTVVGFTAIIPVIGILISAVTSIMISLVNASILTTLYGHYIEKRRL